MRDEAVALLRERGAPDIEHPGGDLFSHLSRTEGILRDWDASEDVCLAGLCHAFYGTDGFAPSLLPLSERSTLRDAIGSGAEAMVYEYCACDRRATYLALGKSPVVFADRFTEATHRMSAAEVHAFALISIANELDLTRLLAFGREAVPSVVEFFRRLEQYAPEAARTAIAEAVEIGA